MSDDELAYLQPGFDLSTLTVPRIRSILVSHDVSYPASAKKPQLIQILTDQVLPKSRKILNARARTKRTSKGITDVPSSVASSTVDEDDEDDGDGELMPPPPPKTPRGRKSKATLAAEAAAREDDATIAIPTTSKKSKTPSARQSTITVKHPRASDTETDGDKPRPSARKTRKSISAPVAVNSGPSVTIDEPDLPLKRESRENAESPFTDDNPFQSGSSPASESRRVSSSTSRSRKSMGSSSEKRKSSSHAASNTSPKGAQKEQSDGARAPSRSTFEFPTSRVKSETVEADDIPITEEFSPEEQLELVRERASKGYSGSEMVRSRPSALVRRKKKNASTATKTAPWVVLVMLLGSLATWYRQETINIGYCGVGETSWSLRSNTHIPAWVSDNLEPSCQPCPQHAYCSPMMELKCENDFMEKPHPLSFGGVVPLPPTCEPDGEKGRRVKAVADKAVEDLRERRAAYECGDEVKNGVAGADGATTGAGDVKSVVKGGVKKLEIAEEELKTEVGKMRRKGMSEEEFEDLWRSALGEIMGREEIVVVQNDSGQRYLSSTSLARLPFTCAIRRSIRLSISRNRVPLLVLTAIISATIWSYFRIATYRQATAQIPTLVATTLDRLATQAALAADGRVDEAFISVGQLRDDVLRATFSVQERERVWKGVRAIVEGNANVRAATREGGRTGEWSRVWEWIGPVNLLPGVEGRSRKSGGMIEQSSPPSEETGGGESRGGGGGGREMVESRKWDEGRAIY